MKLNLIAGFTLAFVAVTSFSQAQQMPPAAAATTPAAAPATTAPVPNTAPGTNYDYHETFGPLFYTKNGNEYRAADGEPGPKY